MNGADPILENWYQDAESGRSFRVVALDDDSDSIEVQYINGDVGEFDSAAWQESAFFPIEPPEDWSAHSTTWNSTTWAIQTPIATDWTCRKSPWRICWKKMKTSDKPAKREAGRLGNLCSNGPANLHHDCD